MVGVIDSVRDRLLEFVLALEEAYPNTGEASIAASTVSQEKVTQVFHTVIMGGNIAVGADTVTQTAGLPVEDLVRLVAELRSLGVPETATEELKRDLAVSTEPKKAAESWLGKLALSGAQGAMSASFAAAVKAIAAHFGLPS